MAPPPQRWFTFGLSYLKAADKWCAVAIVAAAVAFDVGVRGSVDSLRFVLMVAAIVAALVASRRLNNRAALVLLAAAVVASVPLMLRTSPWLVPFDVLAVLLLVTMAVVVAKGAAVFDAGLPTWLLRISAALVHVAAAPDFVLPPLLQNRLSTRNGVRPLLVGLVVIAPVFLVLLVLLLSADSVFASLIDIEFDFADLFLHGFLLAVGAWWIAGLLAAASSSETRWLRHLQWRFGATESVVGLAAVVLLYIVFVVTQVVVWLGGANAVLQTRGLTYAEHAREGFFQLLAVAVLTIGLLLVQRSIIRAGDIAWYRRWQWLAAALVLLTLIILGSALHRLAMYEGAYGLTMLRLYSTVFAVLLGVVLVMVALRVFEVGGKREWLPATVTAAALAVLLGLNIVNPEAVVANRNLARVDQPGATFDAGYVTELKDALPVVAAKYPSLSPARQQRIGELLCYSERRSSSRPSQHWYDYNWSEARAEKARQEICERFRSSGLAG